MWEMGETAILCDLLKELNIAHLEPMYGETRPERKPVVFLPVEVTSLLKQLQSVGEV